jgi:hypothetical protein
MSSVTLIVTNIELVIMHNNLTFFGHRYWKKHWQDGNESSFRELP